MLTVVIKLHATDPTDRGAALAMDDDDGPSSETPLLSSKAFESDVPA